MAGSDNFADFDHVRNQLNSAMTVKPADFGHDSQAN